MVENVVDEKAIGRVIWEGPAFLTSKVWIIWTEQIVRITFAEQSGPDELPVFRTAVALTPADAIAFSKVLADVVKQYEEPAAKQVKAE